MVRWVNLATDGALTTDDRIAVTTLLGRMLSSTRKTAAVIDAAGTLVVPADCPPVISRTATGRKVLRDAIAAHPDRYPRADWTAILSVRSGRCPDALADRFSCRTPEHHGDHVEDQEVQVQAQTRVPVRLPPGWVWLTIELEDDLHAQCTRIAEREGVALSTWLSYAVQSYVTREQRRETDAAARLEADAAARRRLPPTPD
ncbi:hypothetical protein [Dactylosporangium cerinum]